MFRLYFFENDINCCNINYTFHIMGFHVSVGIKTNKRKPDDKVAPPAGIENVHGKWKKGFFFKKLRFIVFEIYDNSQLFLTDPRKRKYFTRKDYNTEHSLIYNLLFRYFVKL